jgi:hypothetical protein
MDEQSVIALLESSQSALEWNRNCDRVKKECGGYPPWWYEKIIMSGLCDRVAARWGGDSKIRTKVG